MRNIRLVLIFVLSLVATCCLASQPTYLTIPGVAGNSLREAWSNSIELTNFSFDSSLEALLKQDPKVISKATAVTIPGGLTSVQLQQAVAQQVVFPSVTVSILSTNANGEEYVNLKVVLTNVKIVASQVSTGGDMGAHSITLVFSSATWSTN